MLSTIGRDRVVGRFVAAYVVQHDRRGILGGPARERELAETMGREILLAMIVEAREALPNFFGKKQKGKLRAEETEAIEAFFREFLAALARAQNWNAEDRRQFRRDLSLYAEFCTRRQVKASERKKRKSPEEEAPFIARIALLLDPSMLEQARGAARKFHGAIELSARKLLRQTLG
jgi:hypothetical protein